MAVNKLLDYVNNQLEKKRLSHIFLLETNDITRCYKDVCEVIKKINCPHTYNLDCHEDCNLCYLIDKEELPSMIKVEADGATIKKEQIINLKEKLMFKAVYTLYNTYIILEADKLNASSANTMLKFLEEPEENIIGFLITTNALNVMTTIKSRCQIFRLFYDEKASASEEVQNQAIVYLKDVIQQKGLEVNKLELDREALTNLFTCLLDMVKKEVINKTLHKETSLNLNIEMDKLVKIMELVEKILQKIKYNVNLDMLLDSFYIEVGRIING